MDVAISSDVGGGGGKGGDEWNLERFHKTVIETWIFWRESLEFLIEAKVQKLKRPSSKPESLRRRLNHDYIQTRYVPPTSPWQYT